MGLRIFAARNRYLPCVILAGIGFAVFSSSAASQSLPAGSGKDVFESICSLCHSPTAVIGKQWTRTEWEAKVREMLQEEPDVTPKEFAAIVEYLSANFKPAAKVNINKATAKELEVALQLSPTGAEAIVRYREENGNFKTLDDLKKVPGLNSEKDAEKDAAKIEASKDRLEF